MSWSAEERLLAVGNLLDGVDIYRHFEPPVWTRTLQRKVVVNNIKQVVFAGAGRLIVSGADEGKAVIWSAENGQELQTLRHRYSRTCVDELN